MGFYVSSVITSVSGAVHGIAQFGGAVYCGIEGNGIYKQTTPGTYKLRSTLFDGGRKHINKTWGRGDFHHSPLLTGQTVVVSTLKDGVTLDSLGSSTTLGDPSAVVDFPSNYKSPYLHYEVSGTANGSDLSILDLSFSYVETPDNPKRVWDLDIAIDGSLEPAPRDAGRKSKYARREDNVLGPRGALEYQNHIRGHRRDHLQRPLPHPSGGARPWLKRNR